MRRALLGAALAVLLAAPAQAATVSAGSLRAAAPDAGAWSLAFDGSAQLRSTALAFRSGTTWFAATRVESARREGEAYVATLATDDPLGRTIRARLAPDAEGVLALHAEADGADAVGLTFAARDGERFLGFGERSNAVDQRGRVVENQVAEGPYRPEDEPIAALAVPPWAVRPRPDAASFPVPWALSTAGYGVLVDDPETSEFALDARDSWQVRTLASHLSVRIFGGPAPADALRRFTARTGRQPAPAHPWFLGVWFMPGDFDAENVPGELHHVRLLREGDVPVSVAETTLQYLPCGDHLPLREVSRQRLAGFHARGLAVLAYLHSQICTDYARAYEPLRPHFVRNEAGQPYVYKQFADRHVQVTVSLVDFTSPGASDAFAAFTREPLDDGYDGFMEDYGEYAPPDGRFADGQTGATMHNRYPTSYHCGVRDGLAGRTPARFVRSGWTGTAACAPLVWSGDPSATWGFDGLQSALRNGLTMGTSGVGFWASELLGLFEFTTKPDDELLARWTQLGAVSAWIKARKKSIPDDADRPQIWEPQNLPRFRRYAKLHTQLYPYLAAAAAEYRRTGLPLMRHLALAFPGDAEAARQDEEFLFGPDLLAAPVLAPGQRERPLYVPGGTWVDLWRSAGYDERTGGLRLDRAPRLIRGPRAATLPAPLDELPLLVRAGAVLPLLPPDVDTLYEQDGPGLVTLGERRDRLELLAFPRGASSARFLDGERLASSEGRGRWTLRVRGTRSRTYRLQASLRALRRPFTPCRVRGARSWRYDARTGVLRATLRGRRPVLRVARCR